VTSDALYERYKEALRRGHVAALRDRLDAAVVAYREAAELAPERALPHASLGSVLVRLRRPEEAVAAYALALDRAPRDEGAQAGRAEALAALGRPVEAADALDRLALQQEADARLREALATATRALELAESRTRRKHVEKLTGQVGLAGGALLPGPETDAPVRAAPPRTEPAAAKPPVAQAEAKPASAPEPRLAPAPEPRPAPAPEPAPEPVAPADGATLSAQAEDRLDAGDAEAAKDRLLAAAVAHRAAGALDAALDACYLALGLAPADPELHLALAELYLDRGWRGPAADKLLLLGRLVDFTRDGTIRERVCELVATRLPDDPRLTALCA
jgi:tetratricopeptide (TPR) repeat protein